PRPRGGRVRPARRRGAPSTRPGRAAEPGRRPAAPRPSRRGRPPAPRGGPAARTVTMRAPEPLPASRTSALARTLRTVDYFALAFGTMVGVGWLVLIDDWLTRGGPGGAMLGFLIGGISLIPVAHVYGQFVRELRDSSSEA